MDADVIVVGTGAGGMAAAVTARKAGLDVVVLEKSDLIGGTTAYSGGVLWVPCNHHALASRPGDAAPDNVDAARRYIHEEAGNHGDSARIEQFLEAGPKMVAFMEQETAVRFYGMDYPDYHTDSPNASTIRSIGTQELRIEELGVDVRKIRNQLPQTLFLGLAVGSGVEMMQFMRAGRSIKAMGFVARKLVKHFADLLRYGEGQQLVRGRALIARLYKTLCEAGTPVLTNATVERLVVDEGRVVGVVARHDGVETTIRARRAVVLACGGYANDLKRRLETFPAIVATPAHRNPVPTGNTGDGIRLAEEAGGHFSTDVAEVAAWEPCSVYPGIDGEAGVWPHLVDRQKPGFIMVLQNGQRFADESQSYHDLVARITHACEQQGYDDAYVWMIADSRAAGWWGIGRARPFPVPNGSHVRSGYLKKAASIGQLARELGIDESQLVQTVARFNGFARSGIDEDFDRGRTIYDKYQGEDNCEPNPCLAPLEKGPYYAVKVHSSEIGTFAGLKTDVNARVLTEGGEVIAGLYAVGNDQASVFAGAYPGAGATLGPAMTFGYVAARHIAALPL